MCRLGTYLINPNLIRNYPSSDIVFLAEIALYGPFQELPDALFYWRHHPEQSIRRSLAVERDRVLWFDSSLKGKTVLPKWLYLFGYLNAIRNAPVSGYAKLYCYTRMVRWILIPDHFRAMGKDVLIAARQILSRTFLNLN